MDGMDSNVRAGFSSEEGDFDIDGFTKGIYRGIRFHFSRFFAEAWEYWVFVINSLFLHLGLFQFQFERFDFRIDPTEHAAVGFESRKTATRAGLDLGDQLFLFLSKYVNQFFGFLHERDGSRLINEGNSHGIACLVLLPHSTLYPSHLYVTLHS